MVEIRDRRSGQVYKGRSFDTLVRRVWGRKAELWIGQRVEGDTCEDFFGQVVRWAGPSDHHAYNVLADVIVYGFKPKA
jgi:hypothetical protein